MVNMGSTTLGLMYFALRTSVCSVRYLTFIPKKKLLINSFSTISTCRLHTIPYAKYSQSTSSASSSSTSPSSSIRVCWSCGEPVPSTSYFCDCGKLQPISQNWSYFDALGYNRPKVKIDSIELSRRMRSVQKHLHPDRYGQTSAYEQSLAAEAAAFINKAYSTLSKSMDRISYILSLRGLRDDGDNSVIESEFLMKVMDLNEEVDSIDYQLTRNADVDSANLGQSISDVVSRLSTELTAVYDQLIDHLENGRWVDAQKSLLKYRYYVRIAEQLHELELGWKRLGIKIDVPACQ